nr:retrovirus-related Pol polyprotein from transposon TNT 1-94 [Tanacetum cinerariifolium]
MHNNIMAAGSRYRPPMLATGGYVKWQSHFIRYVDTKPNGEALRKYILPEWSRFVTIVKQTQDSDKKLYHKLFDILKQYQKEVNEIRAEKISKNENPLALEVQQTGIQCFNYKEFRHFAKECRKPKRAKDYTYHKEKMLLCKQVEKRVSLQAERSDWLKDTDEEIDEQELEVHYSFMAKIQEVLPADSGSDAEPLKRLFNSLTHLNFDTINLLSKKDIVNGLPKLKYVKDQLCSSCELSKAKRSTFNTNTVPSSKGRLNLLHMDLCCSMRIESINGKKYILELSKASDYVNFGPVPQLQNTSNHNRSELKTNDQNNEPSSSTLVPNVSPSADTDTPSLQELDFLFSPLFEEYFTAGNPSVSKSSVLFDNSKQQDTHTTSNVQTIIEPITTTATVTAKENNTDIQAGDAQIDENEFYNIFSTQKREETESSNRYVDSSNIHTFYQPHQSELRLTKDHPLEQVRGNPSKPVQIRRQLAIDPEMCMFALTASTAEPKNINKAMADSAWIEAMQDELHQKKDEDQTVIRNKAQIVAEGYAQEEVYVTQLDGFVDTDHPEKVYRLRKALYGLKQAPRACRFEMSLMREMKFFLELQIQQSPQDADHAGCLDTRKSTSEGIQFLGDKLVSWMSKKQDYTAMSSAEAKYVALSASCAQVMWTRTQLKDYGFDYNKIPLYYDSQSAITISCNPVQHSRTNHINVRYHFIKERVERGIIKLCFVRTEYQLTDMFTKAFPKDQFEYLFRRIGVRCLTPAERKVMVNETA